METAEECQVKDFGKNYQLKKITSQKEKLPIKKKNIWDLISCCNLPVGGPVHINQHLSWLMCNEKKNWIRRAWLPHCGYPGLTANLPNPTFYGNFQTFFNMK